MRVRETGNVDGDSGGWLNTSPVLHPNAMPCTYKLSISGITGTAKNNACTNLNGDYVLNLNRLGDTWGSNSDRNYTITPYPAAPTTHDDDVRYDIGTSRTCSDDKPYRKFGNDIVDAEFFLAGDNPRLPTSGVSYPSNSGIVTKRPNYWVRVSFFEEDQVESLDRPADENVRLYFDTGVVYSGDYTIVDDGGGNLNFKLGKQGYCYNNKYYSGTVDFKNRSFNNLVARSVHYSPSYFGDYPCWSCNVSGTMISLTPHDDYTDTVYDGPYNQRITDPALHHKFNHGLFANSGLPPTSVLVRISGVIEENNRGRSTCDCGDTLNGDHYLKPAASSYWSYSKDLTDESVCCECDRNPCITGLEITLYDDASPSGADLSFSINSESGVLATFSKVLAADPQLPYSYYDWLELPLTYQNPTFSGQCSFSSTNLKIKIEEPTYKHCLTAYELPCAFPCSSGELFTGGLTITIPSSYIDGGLSNPEIAGNTYLLESNGLDCILRYSHGYIGTSGYTIYASFGYDGSGDDNYKAFYITLSESRLNPGDLLDPVLTFYTVWSGVRRSYSTCFGVDCSNMEGEVVYPAVSRYEYVNTWYPLLPQGNITLT